MDTKKRYKDLNTYLRNIYGCRVQKISVDAGLNCPNRDGTISNNGCIYCNNKGSGTGLHEQGLTITEQITKSKERLKKRYKANKFLAYFQSYTNTYASYEKLKSIYDEALAIEDIVGLSIGTRPDCIDKQKIELLQNYTKNYLIWLEYGLQSAHDETLNFINRGHDFKSFVNAVKLTKNRGIKICAHIILGLPNETKDDMLNTAKKISKLGIDGVKLHLLYVIKNTKLEDMYNKKQYKCLTQNQYVDIVCDFLELLPKEIVIQRLTSDPHPDELISPNWSLKKNETLLLINKMLEKRNTYQGCHYG